MFKTKLKKAASLLLGMLACVGTLSLAPATVSAGDFNADKSLALGMEIPSEYGTTLQFKKGVTKTYLGKDSTINGGKWRSSAKSNIDEVNNTNDKYFNSDKTHYLYINDLTSADAGKYWVVYTNVGTYKGRNVDVKFTINSWGSQESKVADLKDGPMIGVRNDQMGFYILIGYTQLNLNCKIYYSDTGDPCHLKNPDATIDDMKWYMYFTDIDGGARRKGSESVDDAGGSRQTTYEELSINTGSYDKYFLTKNATLQSTALSVTKDNLGDAFKFSSTGSSGSTLRLINNKGVATEEGTAAGLNNSTLFLMSKSDFNFSYKKTGSTKVYKSNSDALLCHFNPFATFKFAKDYLPPKLTKSVSTTKLSNQTQGFSYSLYAKVPLLTDGDKFEYYKITDVLPNTIQLNGTGFTVKNSEGESISSDLFTLSQSGQTVTIAAKPTFYQSAAYSGEHYTFTFNVKPKANSDGNLWNSSVSSAGGHSGVWIANNAKVECQYASDPKNANYSGTSCTVYTEVPFKIDTAADSNSTIDASVSNITGGTSKTIHFGAKSGYHISSVTIDGKKYTGSDIKKFGTYASGSYTFNNIIDDHRVEVTSAANYKITTSHRHIISSNGDLSTGSDDCQITPTITNIYPEESKTVTWKPETGYHVKSVTIDGNAQQVNPAGGTYTFSNINSNHDVAVVSQVTTKKVVLTKRIKASDIVWENGNPTFLFKLTGKDVWGITRTYVRSIEFTNDMTVKDGYLTASCTFEDLYCGTYTTSEIDVARYKFGGISDVSANGSVLGQTAVFNLTDGTKLNETGSATFTNDKYEWQDFSHNDIVINSFK